MVHLTKISLAFSLLFLLIFTACEESVEEFTLPESKAYFPIEVGQMMIYQVDSINYFNGGAVVDSVRSFVREEITERFEDVEGEEFYRLERSVRRDLADDWRIADVWLVSRDDEGVYRTEENLRFIKLVFPLTENRTWDHNAFIDDQMFSTIAGGETIQMFRNWQSSVQSLTSTQVVEGEEFNDVAVVIHVDDENVIERRYVEEQYAKGVGLIYREMMILDTQNTTSNGTWREKAEEGFIVRQQLIQRN
ncbi:MAG: hypothetical protein AB8G22_09275 [Saprospiraceae bacterium]